MFWLPMVLQRGGKEPEGQLAALGTHLGALQLADALKKIGKHPRYEACLQHSHSLG